MNGSSSSAPEFQPACSHNGRSTRSRVAFEWLIPLASALLSMVLLTGVIGGLALVIGFPISGVELVFAVVVTGVGLGVWLNRIHGRKWPVPWFLIVAVAAMIILPNLVLGGRVLDDTWDGQWFHQEAVIQLADGWNPFRSELTEAEVPNEGARVRLNGYPKATWFWGASLYKLTHRIERAKAFSLPLMVAAGLAVLACLLIMTPVSPVTAVVIAALAAANPIALTQILNAYQDGAFASLFTIVVAGLVLWCGAGSRTGLVLATVAAVGVAAIKLTGPVYMAILVVSALLWLWRNGRLRGESRSFGIALALAVVGFFLLSGGTFLSNIVRHGHPLYPVYGPDSADIVDAQPHNRFQAMVVSVLARSQRTVNDAEAVDLLQRWQGLKPPFTFDRDELANFFHPNIRIGGWGPVFSGVVVLAVALLLVTFFRRPRGAVVLLVATAPILISVLVNPICWKVRYSPQSWLVPLVIAVVVLSHRSGRIERVLAGAILATAGINVLLVGWAHFPAVIDHSRTLKERLLELGQQRRTLELDFGFFRSNRVRLAELGVAFTEVDDGRHSLPIYLGFSPLAITRLDVDREPGGGGRARVVWQATPDVDGYLVEAFVSGPAGPGGSVLSVVRRWTASTEAVIPIPAGPIEIAVSNCNAIGCGVADVEGPVVVGGVERRLPVFGAPYEGEVVRRPSMLFSWLPAVDEAGRPARYRFVLRDTRREALVVEEETSELWTEQRFADDGSWQARLSVVGSAGGDTSVVGFRTEGVATPRLIAPATGETHREGAVELRWSEVPTASSYEYFVAVTGQPEATARGATVSTSAVVDLTAEDDRATTYSIIIRACLADESCRAGSEIGWGPWSHQAGLGDVKITVVRE